MTNKDEKKMKKLFMAMASIFILIALGIYLKRFENNSSEFKQQTIRNDQKKPHLKSASKTKKNKRAPSSLSSKVKANNKGTLNTNKTISKAGPFSPERILLGATEITEKIQIINTPNPKWNENYQKNLTRFGLKAKNLKVKHVDSVIQVKGDKAQNLEWVKVSYTLGGRPQSYDAYIDSETSQAISTWNIIKFEPTFRKKLSFKPRN